MQRPDRMVTAQGEPDFPRKLDRGLLDADQQTPGQQLLHRRAGVRRMKQPSRVARVPERRPGGEPLKELTGPRTALLDEGRHPLRHVQGGAELVEDGAAPGSTAVALGGDPDRQREPYEMRVPVTGQAGT